METTITFDGFCQGGTPHLKMRKRGKKDIVILLSFHFESFVVTLP
jgi:hypothetical protein